MIIQTTKEINGVVYDYTCSDSGMKILRDGVEYDEAIDPAGSGRTYTESDTPREAKTAATDADASRVIGIYSTMKHDGSLIRVGTRIRFGNKLYRARVDLWDTEEYTPDAVPLLWEEVLYKDGYRIIANITAENPFANGDKGWYNGVLYQSKLDNNVWTPDEFPAGWVLTDEGGNE